MLIPSIDLAERRPARAGPDAMLIDFAERRPARAERDALPIPSVDLENAAPRAAAQDSC